MTLDNKRKLFMGIDLGKTGGIALLDEEGEILLLESMPQDHEIVKRFFQIFDEYIEASTIDVLMEHTSARPGEGVVSVRTFGYHCGGIYFMLESLRMVHGEDNISIAKVHPMLWKKHYGLTMPDESSWEKKKAGVERANSIFKTKIKNSNNGQADALLIALYARDSYLQLVEEVSIKQIKKKKVQCKPRSS